MYEVEDDRYCYSGTSVLRNIAGLRDQDALDEFEIAITTQRLDEPLPVGKFGVTHFKNVHKHIFQDIYSWAGKVRTVRISKGRSAFCFPEHIDSQLNRLFYDLRSKRYLRKMGPNAFCSEAAVFLAQLNAIHAFRDGNGRAQMAFLAMLASFAGHPLDFTKLEPEPFLRDD